MRDRRFAEAFLKARGITSKAALREALARLGHGDGEPVQVDSLRTDDDEPPASRADLAWHLRAWGQRVLDGVRREAWRRATRRTRSSSRSGTRVGGEPPVDRPKCGIAPGPRSSSFPANTDTCRRRRSTRSSTHSTWRTTPIRAGQPSRPLHTSGHAPCGAADCRAEIPLLKTRWLCRKDKKRVLLTIAPGDGGERVELGIRHGVPEGSGKRRAEARARPDARRRHHERERCNVSVLRRHRDDPGHSRRGSGRSARRTHDRGRRGRAGGQGVSPADRGRDRSLARDGGGPRPALRGDSLRPSRRAHQPGTAVAELARRLRAAPLRIRDVAAGVHEPPASRARHVHSGHTPLRRRDGRLSRRMARGIAGVSRTVDQPLGRSRLCAGDVAERSRKDPQHVRPLRATHGMGLRGVLPRGRHHRRVHPGRRVDSRAWSSTPKRLSRAHPRRA